MDLLVFWLCFFNVVGTMPRNLFYILTLLNLDTLSFSLKITSECFKVMHRLTHGCSIFILYSFNKIFRNVLSSYFT